MGCGESKPYKDFKLLEQYQQAGLRQPWSNEYENEFEKQVYMATNLFRYDPKRYLPLIRKMYI